jgi:putative flippase GtrA
MWSCSPQALRFVAAGGANALATYLVYLAMLRYVGYPVAYTTSYVLGIAFSYVANARLVFRTPMSAKSAARFPLVCVFQYLAGMALMWLQIGVGTGITFGAHALRGPPPWARHTGRRRAESRKARAAPPR